MIDRKQTFSKFTVTLFFGAVFLPLSTFADDLPLNAGTEVSVGITQRQEQMIGDNIMRKMRRNAPLLQDAIINDYTDQLTSQLKKAVNKKDVHFNYFVLEDNTVNAFALPGGYVGIHTGLLTTAESESELAAVLSHEMAHVTQRHIAQMLERSKLYTIPTIAAAVGSILVATQNPNVGAGALAATLGSSQQAMINFTREFEGEADRIGIETMAKAGFDPRAMPRFFERMAERNRYMPKIPDFLLNHPVTERRIADSRMRADKYPVRNYVDNPNFYLIQQRIAINEENNPQESIERLQAEMDNSSTPHREASEYGYVIALTKAFQLEDAQKAAEKLVAKHPDQYIYHLALADIENINKNFADAIPRLQKMQNAHPNTRAIPIQLANTALNAGQGQLALKTLQKYVQNFPDDSSAYELLTEANAVVGDSIGAHRAQAEEYALEGDYNGAIDQLTSAQKLAEKDKYLSAKIKARKAELEKAQAEQKKNKVDV